MKRSGAGGGNRNSAPPASTSLAHSTKSEKRQKTQPFQTGGVNLIGRSVPDATRGTGRPVPGCRYRGAGQREKAPDFIQAHPQYKFLFFTDPNMKRDVSPSGSFFSVLGIAVTALTDGQGKITDRWSGFDGEENLRKKLTKLMKR